MPIRHSGLQREVLGLYRAFIRLAYQKGDLSQRQYIIETVRKEFKGRKDWPLRDFDTIENWVKQGQRRLLSLERAKSVQRVVLS
mmetsp:Transcript_2395/g.6679  ORF Transcript_2395/g.6679 Transcript_2395/m.6679 type:complete len:84 (+) Transcript_2395:77-328(+)